MRIMMRMISFQEAREDLLQDYEDYEDLNEDYNEDGPFQGAREDLLQDRH